MATDGLSYYLRNRERILAEQRSAYVPKPAWQGVCEKCEKSFEHAGRGRKPRFCSTKCHDDYWIAERAKQAAERLAAKPESFGICKREGCDNQFKRHPRERRVREFCSTGCREKFYHAVEDEKRRAAQQAALPTCVIPGCGKLCRKADAETCCPAHARQLANKRHPGGHHRRAKRHGGTYERGINPLRVFERDGWICQINGEKTVPRWRGTKHALAPELDHIIPLKLGGSHTWDNVQTACRRCNRSKGAKLAKGHLSLFARPE